MDRTTQVKIAIAEDHALLRATYRNILSEREDFCLVLEAENGKILTDALATNEVHIVLLDLEMPVMNGKEAFRLIKKEYPHIKVIIISSFYDEQYITHYFTQGANGYLSKSSEPEEIHRAIDSVATQNFYCDRSISRTLTADLFTKDEYKNVRAAIQLTDLETKILQLICAEKSSREICDILKIEQYSVDHYRRKIQQKTGQSSVIGLFKYAITHGIAEPPPQYL